MDHPTTETFDANARAALANVQLRGALRNATSLFGARRLEAARGLDNWEELRSQARAVKDESLLHLDQYLEEIAAHAEKVAAQIHWARDADEANGIVCHIAVERGAWLAVISNSMVTEDIHL